jgi:hypothetical protein
MISIADIVDRGLNNMKLLNLQIGGIMKTLYQCDVCLMEFENPLLCEEHEFECRLFALKECYKCGKIENIEVCDSEESGCALERWHELEFNTPGYGSMLDGIHSSFVLCDNCLINLLDSFPIEYQEKIYNDGEESTEEWIARVSNNREKV